MIRSISKIDDYKMVSKGRECITGHAGYRHAFFAEWYSMHNKKLGPAPPVMEMGIFKHALKQTYFCRGGGGNFFDFRDILGH